jgi:hypothetical protein
MKATVVNTVENTTKVVELPEVVTDLSGLKHFLDISDGQFFEGTTHTDLTSNTQALPQLPESKKERGYVFFVSPAQNKIKNGAYTRKECYAIIKSNNLGDKIKAKYGRNFTQVATDALNETIEENVNDVEVPTAPEENPTPVEDTDAGKITTEKELLQKIVDKLAQLNNNEEITVDDLVEGVNRVFPTPYSVQDLSNMRK